MDVHAFCVDKRTFDHKNMFANWQKGQSDFGKVTEKMDSPLPESVLTKQYSILHDAQPDYNQIRNITSADKGVHLHWVLPPALRRSHTDGTFNDTLPLPNRWLIIRIGRNPSVGGSPQTGSIKCWLIDNGAEDATSNINTKVLKMKEDKSGYEVGKYGKVYDLSEQPDLSALSDTHLDALGNLINADGTSHRLSSNPSFSADVVNNRFTASFHDPLDEYINADLTQTQDVILSYQCIGWYGNADQNPLQQLNKRKQWKSADDILNALKWQLADQGKISDVSKADSLFHGMTGYLYFFDSHFKYQGKVQTLGMPNCEGTPGNDKPITIGAGNNPIDAMIALGMGQDLGTKSIYESTIDEIDDIIDNTSNFESWKVLETIAYRQLHTLISKGGGIEMPREFKVHQSWFKSVHSGVNWQVIGRQKNANEFLPSPFVPKEISISDKDKVKISISKLPTGATLSNKKGAITDANNLTLDMLEGLKITTSPTQPNCQLLVTVTDGEQSNQFNFNVFGALAKQPPIIGLANTCGKINTNIPLPIAVSSILPEDQIALSIELPAALKKATIGNNDQGEIDLSQPILSGFDNLYINVPKGTSIPAGGVAIKVIATAINRSASSYGSFNLDVAITPPKQPSLAAGFCTAFLSLTVDRKNAEAAIGLAILSNTSLSYLNSLEASYEALTNDYNIHQQNLYSIWYQLASAQKQLNSAAGFNKRHLKPKVEKLKSAFKKYLTTNSVQTLTEKANALRIQLSSLPLALTNLLVATGKGRLKSTTNPRFWRPTDPIIVLHDENAETIKDPTEKYAAKVDALLPCRALGKNNFLVATSTVNSTQISQNFMDGLSPNEAIDTPSLKYFLTQQNELKISDDLHSAISSILQEGIVAESLVYTGMEALKSISGSTYATWRSNGHSLLKISDGWFNGVTSGKTPPGSCNVVNISNVKMTYEGLPTPFNQTEENKVVVFELNNIIQFWGKQPWSPLYLEWEADWYSYEVKANGQWEYKRFDYSQSTAYDTSKLSSPKTISGRSMLTPIAGKHLAKKPFEDALEELEDFLNTPEGKSAGGVRTAFNNLQKGIIYGMTLSGFHQELMGRNVQLPKLKPNATVPWYNGTTDIDTSIEPTMADLHQPMLQTGSFMNGQLILKRAKPVNMAPPSGSADNGSLMRSGFFAIKKMVLVDDFGQWKDIMIYTNNQRFPNPHGLTKFKEPGSEKYYSSKLDQSVATKTVRALPVQLPPRFLQPTQMSFRFKSANDLAVDTHPSDPSTNPVIGWVVHNFMSNSLLVCYPDGSHYGELTLVYDNKAPSSSIWDFSFSEPAMEMTPHHNELLQFRTRLNDPIALQNLLKTIDQGLNSVRPATKHGLISGRPLALVRSEVGLRQYGSQNLYGRTNTAKPNAKGWPVDIGSKVWLEDGLIGYFVRDPKGNLKTTYNQFFTKHQYDMIEQPTKNSYVQNISKNLTPIKPFIGFNKPLALTMLMDPLGIIQATIGILPSKAIRIPTEFIQDALHYIELTIHKRPVLHTRQIAIAKPGTKSKNWVAHDPSGHEVPYIPIGHKPAHDKARTIASDIRLVLKHPKKKPSS